MNINFNTETKTPLGASATFTGGIHDLNTLSSKTKIRACAFSNQVGTLRIEHSMNGITFRIASQTAVAVNTTAMLELNAVLPYARVVFVNGATANTILEINSALVY